MPETWTLTRLTLTPDGEGGFVQSYSTVTSGSAFHGTGASLAPGGYRSRETRIGEQPVIVGSWTITLPVGTDVRPPDRIVIRSRTFEVAGIGGPHSFDVAVQVGADEVT